MDDLLVVQLFRRSGGRRRQSGGWLARWWRGLSRRWRWGRRKTSKDYAIWMASPSWRAQRARVLMRDNWRCCDCLTAKATEVHHLWYARPLSAHPDYGLTSLCERCHRRRHAHRATAPTSRRLW